MKKRISKNIFHFSNLIIELKNEKRKMFFWICFKLKPISKNKNQNFRIHFLIWNQKMNFKKFFHFSIFILKLKNEKWKTFKILFNFKSKNGLYFRYMDSFSCLIDSFFEFLILHLFFIFIKKWKTKYSLIFVFHFNEEIEIRIT